MNHLRPLATLIAEAEKMFRLPTGQLATPQRHQPLISVKALAMLVAYEAEYSYAHISRAFHVDKSSVAANLERAREHIKSEHGWWLNGKADLFDAWQDALDA